MIKLSGYYLYLTGFLTAIGTRIHFNQGNDVRLHSTDKGNNLTKGIPSMFKKTTKRQGQMVAYSMSGCITDIIEKKTHTL